eukprot:XP_001702845.1 R-SNARE protein, tomsyn-like family [Chlamydomonas reinhardtii]
MFGLGKPKTREVAPDKLRTEAVSHELKASIGIPGTADALAYEPVQGAIAVSTSDGKGGFMECWSVTAGNRSHGGVRSLGSVKVRHDKICCVADMARDPYVLMGCASGGLRIAMLADAAGAATSQPRAVRKLVVAPYRVRREELGGEGEVRQLAVQSLGPVHRALVLFTAGMVAVWDLRAAQRVCCLDAAAEDAAEAYPALAAAGAASAVCWVGTRHGDFATGHEDGSVLVWSLPGLEVGEPNVEAALRVVPGAAEPIRMLRCAYGEVEGLLVVGGGEPEQPEGLALLPLPEPAQQGRKDKTPAPLKLPWFGHLIGFTLVSQGRALTGYEDPVAVLQLVEGGQLVLFDLAAKAPANVTPTFQQRTGITVTEAALVPVRRPSGSAPTAISLAGLRKVAAEAEAEDETLRDPSGGLGAFEAGVPPPLPGDASWGLVYCTGYKDGGVCLWDLHGGNTRLLASAPLGDAADPSFFAAAPSAAASAADPSSSGGGAGSSSPGSVTALSLVWSTGLVLAGHHRGELRVYQFSGSDRTADCLALDSVNTPGTAVSLWQPAGLQLRLRVRVSSGEITSLAYCQSIRAIAVGDKSGGVALVDTGRPVVRWYAMPCSGAALAVALAPLPLPPAKARLPELAGAGEEGAPSHTVVVADAEGCLAALDAARGCFVGKGGELRPKNHSYSLCLELLDESYSPLWNRQQLGAGFLLHTLAVTVTLKSGAGRRGRADDTEDTSGSVLAACPDPTGHHVLLVTDQYLRLYSAANVMAGDRTVAAKRHVAPGQQLVYSLPSLELVHESPLSGCLSWYWDVPPGHARKLGRLAATSRLGQLQLLGLGNELLQMGAAAEYEATHMAATGRLSREPSAPVPESHVTESGPSDIIDGIDSPAVRTEGRRVDKGPAAAVVVAEKTALVAEKAKEAAKEANVTLTKVFSKVQQGLTRAVEETTKGVKTLATGVAGGVAQVQQALIDGSGGAAEQAATAAPAGGRKMPPVPDDDAELMRMRRKARAGKPAGGAGGSDEEESAQPGGGVEEEEDDDVSLLSITDDEDDSSSPAKPRPPGRQAAAPPPPAQPARRPAAPAPAYGGSAARSSGGDENSMRADLFGGARPYTSTGGGAGGARASGAAPAPISAPKQRTADEIKLAYGRPTTTTARANDVREVMEQNRNKLAERGEKLGRLNDKAADLEASAQGFADMARQLAERERNKKWWQL